MVRVVPILVSTSELIGHVASRHPQSSASLTSQAEASSCCEALRERSASPRPAKEPDSRSRFTSHVLTTEIQDLLRASCKWLGCVLPLSRLGGSVVRPSWFLCHSKKAVRPVTTAGRPESLVSKMRHRCKKREHACIFTPDQMVAASSGFHREMLYAIGKTPTVTIEEAVPESD